MQRIAGDEPLRTGDGLHERAAVGGERGQEPEAVIDVDRGDRGEVAPRQSLGDERARRLLRLGPAVRRREAHVEEEEEAAPRRRVQRRGLLHVAGGEIDAVEGGDLARLPLVDDLEVRLGQTAHGVAVAVDDGDRHLDEVDVDGLAELRRLSEGGGRARYEREGDAAEATHPGFLLWMEE